MLKAFLKHLLEVSICIDENLNICQILHSPCVIIILTLVKCLDRFLNSKYLFKSNSNGLHLYSLERRDFVNI